MEYVPLPTPEDRALMKEKLKQQKLEEKRKILEEKETKREEMRRQIEAEKVRRKEEKEKVINFFKNLVIKSGAVN